MESNQIVLPPVKKLKTEEEERPELEELEDEGFVSLKPDKEKCQVCFQNEYRYKCPGCLTKTCSLTCVNEHKVLKECDGKYHHEKFISLNQMDEGTMRKDIQYLSEMMRGSENIKKKLSTLKKTQEQLRFKLLKIYAKKFHNVKIKLAPTIMTKHRENLSFYHTKSKNIYWSIGLRFCSFLKSNPTTELFEPSYQEINILLDPQDEKMSLFEILQSTKLTDSRLLWYLQEKFNSTNLLDNISCSRLFCYIWDEENPRQKMVRRLDWYVAFKDAIRDITVTEYPTVLIVSFKEYDQFEQMYKVISEPLLDVTPTPAPKETQDTAKDQQ